jgi:hypothetical protein
MHFEAYSYKKQSKDIYCSIFRVCLKLRGKIYFDSFIYNSVYYRKMRLLSRSIKSFSTNNFYHIANFEPELLELQKVVRKFAD